MQKQLTQNGPTAFAHFINYYNLNDDSPERRPSSEERVSGRNRAYTFSVMSVLP